MVLVAVVGTRSLAFLDKMGEVQPWLNRWQSAPAGHLAVALKPAIRAALESRGVPQAHTLAYFTSASHASALELSDRLSAWLRVNGQFVSSASLLHETYREALVFRARLVAHYCIWLIEIISNAIERHQPDVLSASLTGGRPASCFCIEPEENYVGRVVSLIARQKGLGFNDLGGRSHSYQSLSVWKPLRYSRELAAFLLRYGFHLGKARLTLLASRQNGEAPVMVTTKSYGMEALAQQLQTICRGLSVCWLEGPVLPSVAIPGWVIKALSGRHAKDLAAQKELLEALAVAVEQERQLFAYRGVPFAGLVSEKIRTPIANHLIGLHLWSRVLNDVMESTRPKMVLSCGNRDDDFMLAELCTSLNIPSMLVSHGSHVRPKNGTERIEWGEHGRGFLSMPFSHLALASPLAEGYIEAFPCPGQPVRTGPLTWGKPVNRNRSERLLRKWINREGVSQNTSIVLHAGTAKSTNTLRLHVYETPDEYIQSLCDLAEAVKRLPDTLLVIKFRPSNELSVTDIKALVPFSEQVILETEALFLDLLSVADLLISFSSTTIEEALQNRIPVLLYGGSGRYQHVPAQEVKTGRPAQAAAVYHVREALDIPYAISTILDLQRGKREDGKLFEPYIYPPEARVSLRDILQGLG